MGMAEQTQVEIVVLGHLGFVPGLRFGSLLSLVPRSLNVEMAEQTQVEIVVLDHLGFVPGLRFGVQGLRGLDTLGQGPACC